MHERTGQILVPLLLQVLVERLYDVRLTIGDITRGSGKLMELVCCVV